MKLSEIIATLQDIHKTHGDLWFKVEAKDSITNEVTIGNDFQNAELWEENGKPVGVILQVESCRVP